MSAAGLDVPLHEPVADGEAARRPLLKPTFGSQFSKSETEFLFRQHYAAQSSHHVK